MPNLPLAAGRRQRPTAEIFYLHPQITERHQAYLHRWVDAGGRMGLLDAMVSFQAEAGSSVRSNFVLIWVRETPDPAYRVTPVGAAWIVRDEVRGRRLGQFPTFEQALDFIRPALPLATPEAERGR